MDSTIIFSEIAEMLVALIPKRVSELTVRVPVYAIMVEYYTSTVGDDVVPTLSLPNVQFRERVLAAKGESAAHYLWCPAELPVCPEIVTTTLPYPELVSVVKAHANLVSRRMARAVAKRLNSIDWSEILPVSNDFVVVASDATQSFMDTIGDIKASVSEAQWKKLQENKRI